MSDLDLDIRAVSNAAYGNRASVTDPSAAAQEASSQASSQQAGDGSSTASALSAASAQLRYDSFRFIYKPDYGRIVLIDQSPVTGEQIAQIPSQRALELYAEQRRSEAKSVLMSGEAGSGGNQGRGRRMTTTVTSSTALSTVSMAALAPVQMPAISAAAAKPVNITI